MVCKVTFFSKRFGKFGSGVLYFRSFSFCKVSIAKNFVACKIKSVKGWVLFFGQQVLLKPHTPNKACSGRRGVCAVYRHFSGFELFLHLKPFSTPPASAANASRWATRLINSITLFEIK